MTVEQRLVETEAAFRFAVARYWRDYDGTGPVFTLLAPLAVVLECLDDRGVPKPEHALDLPRFVAEARRCLESFAEYGRRPPEGKFGASKAGWAAWKAEVGSEDEWRRTVCVAFDRMEEEMEGFRERWRGK